LVIRDRGEPAAKLKKAKKLHKVTPHTLNAACEHRLPLYFTPRAGGIYPGTPPQRDRAKVGGFAVPLIRCRRRRYPHFSLPYAQGRLTPPEKCAPGSPRALRGNLFPSPLWQIYRRSSPTRPAKIGEPDFAAVWIGHTASNPVV